MSKVFFISDLHLGHEKIAQYSGPYRGGVTTVEEHDNWIVQQWNSVVTKADLVYVLGDVVFNKKKLPLIKRLNGSKHLILGNHDELKLSDYAIYFNRIHGFMRYKGVWLSHAPIHSGSLRNLLNVHGHVHQNEVPDPRYISVCVEALNGVPISWEELNAKIQERKKQIQIEKVRFEHGVY